MKFADGKTMHAFFQALFGAWAAVAEVEEEIHAASGLTGSQKKNLAHLLSGGVMTISDLAFARKVSRQSVQVAITTLMELEYVELQDNPRHKQAKLISVTDLGRSRFLESEEAEHALIERSFPAMDEKKMLTAISVLNEVKAILEQHPPKK